MPELRQGEWGELFGMSKRQTSQYITGASNISEKKLQEIAEACNAEITVKAVKNKKNETTITIVVKQSKFL